MPKNIEHTCPGCAAGFPKKYAMTVIDRVDPTAKKIALVSEATYKKFVRTNSRKGPEVTIGRKPEQALAELVLEKGFASPAEWVKLVASADLSTAAKVAEFSAWKNADGTKAGLERVLARIGTLP